jgi:hypothetical protein
MITRRQFTKLGAAALLAEGLWPGRLRAAENGLGDSDWSFIAVNDLHYSSAECTPWFEKVVLAMKASAPQAEFCILGGDLSDTGQKQQLAAVRDLFKNFGATVYSTPGNHDYFKNDDRAAYDELYPGQNNQSFEHRGWQFVGLDTTDGMAAYGTKIHDSTFEWLRWSSSRTSRSMRTSWVIR